MNKNNIRNFCILAHIDHGKSTLADRFLELTGTVEKRKMREQFLDMNPLEREKGITIKMQPVRMNYEKNGQKYIFNLIDTPGHVDFSYEVSRALVAVEGAILLVDATQGIQAQTIANLNLAQKTKTHGGKDNFKIIPVINKIDLPSAEIQKTEDELKDLLGVAPQEIIKISAKVGTGVDKLLDNLVDKIPPPEINEPLNLPLRALIFDSTYDPYQGVIAYIRVFEGTLKKGDIIRFMASQSNCEMLETGTFSPDRTPRPELKAGEIGYIATGIKETERVRVGDTITKESDFIKNKILAPLPGYQEPTPMVFASIFPENQDDYDMLKDSLKKLKLNDAAIMFEPEQGTAALGRGFRIGFLGMLHMEIVSERLKREYNLKLVFSSPSVAFRIKTKTASQIIYSPIKMPDSGQILSIEEPWVRVEVISPPRFLGSLTSLINESGGQLKETLVLAGDRLLIKFEAPLREIVIDFYDRLKSVSQGFASMAYEMADYKNNDLARLDIIVAGEKVPAFSEIIPRDRAYHLGRQRILKLKELLPRELFSVSLQAETEGRIIARETIQAMKKDVTGYLYGGDRTRKMKLWKKQQKGKKRLLASAHVDIPPEVFLKMMKK